MRHSIFGCVCLLFLAGTGGGAAESEFKVRPGLYVVVLNVIPVSNRNREFVKGAKCQTGYDGTFKKKQTLEGFVLAEYETRGYPMDDACPSGVTVQFSETDLASARKELAREQEREFLRALTGKR